MKNNPFFNVGGALRAAILLAAAILSPNLAFPGATNLPALSTQGVMTDSNGVIVAPVGLLASNAVALANPAVLLADESFATMATADGITWTNAAGWSSTAEATNGLIKLDTGSVLSPLLTGAGFRALTPTWSNLSWTAVYEVSTNDTTWMALSPIDGATAVWPSYRIRISAPNQAPPLPGETNSHALLNSVRIDGHQIPGRSGATNDFHGIVIRVDNPVGSRDAVNLQTLEGRLAAYVPGTASGSSWSTFPASNVVDFAGYGLQLDPRYLLSISGDTVSLTFGGAPVLELTGSATSTPRIVSFHVAGSNLSAAVVGAIGWRPYPQWCTNLVSGSWASLATNQFNSTYPAVTNGLFSLSWDSLGYATEYWRIIALDETGGSNGIGLATFHVPVAVPSLTVNGVPFVPGEAILSNAVHAMTADDATRAGSATTAGYATNAGAAVTAGYATNAGNAATAGYATNAGAAATATAAGTAALADYANDAATADYADSAGRASYATNAGNALTAGTATTAGSASTATYATSAGNARIGGVSYPLGTAALLSSNAVAPGSWITSIVQVTNLIVTATNGANYNGPPVGRLMNKEWVYNGDMYWQATNGAGDAMAQLNDASGFWLFEEMYANYAYFTNSTRAGTYSAYSFNGFPGTGTFTLAETYYWQTNTARYFDGGTGNFSVITGPATNQFAPPISAPVRWSGVWTNILSGVTNLLQFFDGYATNKLTL
jgi:hypothetical protein